MSTAFPTARPSLTELANCAWDPASFAAKKSEIAALSADEVEQLLEMLANSRNDDIFRHRLVAALRVLDFVGLPVRMKLAESGWVKQVGGALFEFWWHEVGRVGRSFSWGFGCDYFDYHRVAHIGDALGLMVTLGVKTGWSIRWDVDAKGLQPLLRVIDRSGPAQPILKFIQWLLDDAYGRREVLWPNLRSFYRPGQVIVRSLITLHRLRNEIQTHSQMQQTVLQLAATAADPMTVYPAVDVLLQHHDPEKLQKRIAELRSAAHQANRFPEEVFTDAEKYREADPVNPKDSRQRQLASASEAEAEAAREWAEEIVRTRDADRMYQHISWRCGRFCTENNYQPSAEFWKLLMECVSNHSSDQQALRSLKSIWERPTDWRRESLTPEIVADVIAPVFVRILRDIDVDSRCKEIVVEHILLLAREAAVSSELVSVLVDLATHDGHLIDAFCNFAKWNAIRALVEMGEGSVKNRPQLGARFINDRGRVIWPIVVCRWHEKLLRDDDLVSGVLREACEGLRLSRGHLVTAVDERAVGVGRDLESALGVIGQLVRYANVRVFVVRGKFAWARVGDLKQGGGPTHFIEGGSPRRPAPGSHPATDGRTPGASAAFRIPEMLRVNGLFGEAFRLLSALQFYVDDRSMLSAMGCADDQLVASLAHVCDRLELRPTIENLHQDPLGAFFIALMEATSSAQARDDTGWLQRLCDEVRPVAERLGRWSDRSDSSQREGQDPRVE